MKLASLLILTLLVLGINEQQFSGIGVVTAFPQSLGRGQPAGMVAFTDTANMRYPQPMVRDSASNSISSSPEQKLPQPPTVKNKYNTSTDSNRQPHTSSSASSRIASRSDPFIPSPAKPKTKTASINHKSVSAAAIASKKMEFEAFPSLREQPQKLAHFAFQESSNAVPPGSNNNKSENQMNIPEMRAPKIKPISASYQHYEKSLTDAQRASQHMINESIDEAPDPSAELSNGESKEIVEEYQSTPATRSNSHASSSRKELNNSSDAGLEMPKVLSKDKLMEIAMKEESSNVSHARKNGVLYVIKDTARNVQDTAKNVQTSIEEVQIKAQNVQAAIENVQSKAKIALDTALRGERELPKRFAVDMIWPHMLSPALGQPELPLGVELNGKNMPLMLAFRCLNARGSIAHGKSITQYFKWDDVENKILQKKYYVRDVFERYGGGAKELNSINEIKQELITNGPVMSISFQLTKEYYDLRYSSCEISMEAFLPQKETSHELLIVGWDFDENGENWLVQSVGRRNSLATIPIGFSEFDIDTLCLAPRSSRLNHLAWQPGPYLDINFQRMKKQFQQNGVTDWRDEEQLDLIVSYKQLETFLEQFGTTYNNDGGKSNSNKDNNDNGSIISLIGMVTGGTRYGNYPKRFLIRDENKFAHSQYYTLRDVRYDSSAIMNKWIIAVDRCPFQGVMN